MANPKKLANFSLITIFLSLSNIFQIIHATKTNTTTRNHKGFSLRLIHRDYPESPIYRANLTDAERRKEHIELSNRRVKSLFTNIGNKTNRNVDHFNPNDDDDDPKIRLPMRIDNFIYFVQLGIGSFDGSPDFVTIYLGIDTASGLIWTQCEGCVNCFHQIFPFYPASQSHSYTRLPCSECPPSGVCVDNTCRMTRRYGDGSTVTMIMALETFTFESDPDITPLDLILFGCGIDMQGFHEDSDPHNKVSGLFGMSLSDYSFIKQAEVMVQGKFSYCLQKFQQGIMPPMYLRFGDDVREPVSTVSSIPLLQNPHQPEYYYLDLRGIKVGDKDLVLPSGVFDIKEDGTGGCFIDTGTPISRLTTEAYRALKEEVAAYIESKNTNVERFDDHNTGYDLCYRRVREPTTVVLPWVTWVFANNANFLMNPDVVFETFSANGFALVCLTIVEGTQDEGGVTILGSDHQVGHRIIYDISNGQLHFANEDCSQGR